jgi:hypothetical protein
MGRIEWERVTTRRKARELTGGREGGEAKDWAEGRDKRTERSERREEGVVANSVDQRKESIKKGVVYNTNTTLALQKKEG